MVCVDRKSSFCRLSQQERHGPQLVLPPQLEDIMKKFVLAALAVFTLAIAIPVTAASAATVSEAARLGDANGNSNSNN